MGKAFTLRNGLILLSTEAPGGIYNAAQLKKVSALCDQNTAIVKATEDQRLALFVKPEDFDTVKQELQSVGLGVRHYQDGLHQPVNCVGNLCKESLQDALSTSMALQKELATLQLSSSLRIGINGCYRCCVPTHTLDISIIGDSKGYRMSLGGKNTQIPEMAMFMAENVPADAVPRLVKQIITIYQRHAQEDESLQDVIDRVGSSDFVQALHPYSQDAAAGADPFSEMNSDSESLEDLTDVANLEEIEEMPDDLGNMIDSLPAEDDLEPTRPLPRDDMDSVIIDNELSSDISLDSDVSVIDANAGLIEDALDFGDADQTMNDPMARDDALLVDSVAGLDVSESEMIEDLSSLQAEEIEFEAEHEFEKVEMAELAEPMALEAEAVSDELPLDESGNMMTADEVDESEADAFEEKLNQSIEEEERFPEIEDDNSETRIAAMRLVEAAGVEEEVLEPGDDSIIMTEDHEVSGFDNLEIERDSADFNDDIERIDLSPEVFDESMEDEPKAPAVTAVRSTHSGNELSGIDFLGGNTICLRFESGTEINFDLNSMRGEKRDISAFGKVISIRQTSNGVNILVDGFSVFYPKAVA